MILVAISSSLRFGDRIFIGTVSGLWLWTGLSVMTATITKDAPLGLDVESAEARIQSWLAKADELLLRLEQAQTHYAVLNLDLGASAAEITTAYHETVIGLTRAFNDLRNAVPGGRLQGFKTALARVREAYSVLNSTAGRAKYDESLPKNPPAQPQTGSGKPTRTPAATPTGTATGFDITQLDGSSKEDERARPKIRRGRTDAGCQQKRSVIPDAIQRKGWDSVAHCASHAAWLTTPWAFRLGLQHVCAGTASPSF